MSQPFDTGALAYRELPSFQRTKPCPRCGDDERPRVWNELCAKCQVDPAVIDARRRSKNGVDRRGRGYRRRKAGIVGKNGRPRIAC